MAEKLHALDNETRSILQSLPGPVAVFGAGGFIGFNLFLAVRELRDDVFAVTHDLNASWRLQQEASIASHIIFCDLNSATSIDHFIHTYRPQTVFNLAAYGAYARQKNVELIYATNFLSTVKLIQALSREGFGRYVHAGSSSEYGTNASGPSETEELTPNSHYAVSKTGNSYYIKYCGKVLGMPVVNLRLYSVFGPWEEPDRLVATLIEHARAKIFPPLVSPDNARDFVYISDVIRAFAAAAGKMGPSCYGDSFNIGTGVMTTIRDIASTVKDLFGIPQLPLFNTMESREWDLDKWYCNGEKALREFGWRPIVSLGDGLRSTYEWQESVDYKALKARFARKRLHTAVEVSAVVACYKDGQAIQEMYERLTAVFNDLDTAYEIIFVNDHSPDTSGDLLREMVMKDGNVIAVEHSRNFGSQSAFMSGMEVASGHAVVVMDGDLQDPPELIKDFYKQWKNGFDIVYGKRIKRDAPLWLNVSYRAFYRLFRKMAYIDVPTDAGDFSLLDRKVVDELLRLPEKDLFLRGLRAWVGFKQTGVPYLRPRRKHGRSTNSIIKNIQWAKKGIFSFTYLPLEIMGYTGAVMMFLCFLATIGQIVSKLLYPNVPHGITTIIVIILFLGGLQLFAMSLLGEYISKIFEETKSRPKFIRNAIIHAGREYSKRSDMDEFLRKRKLARLRD
jgi:polyisoprenyl-phosphate glycosyltransferase